MAQNETAPERQPQNQELPPVKTEQYPGRPTSPRFYFRHRPTDPKLIGDPKRAAGCPVNHQSLPAAYKCARKKPDRQQILLRCPSASGHPTTENERPVGPDELALHQLQQTEHQHYALVADLKLREVPVWEEFLREPAQRNAYPYTAQEQVCYDIYLLARRALLAHHFYTTPAPTGAYPSEYASLLPNELVNAYQQALDKMAEAMLQLQNRYNELQRKFEPSFIIGNPMRPLQLSDMLTYTLEPYQDIRRQLK